MKYLSDNLLDGLYNQTEKNLERAITEWQQLPHIRLLAKPAPEKWSAIQCMEHLNSYGRYYLPAIEKAITSREDKLPAEFFKSGLIGAYFYKLMLPASDGKVKKRLQSPKDHLPGKDPDVAKVLNEFISQQELTGRLLQQAGKININKSRVGISIAPFIKLKLGDIFLFLIAHVNRHVLQAENALKESCYNLSSTDSPAGFDKAI